MCNPCKLQPFALATYNAHTSKVTTEEGLEAPEMGVATAEVFATADLGPRQGISSQDQEARGLIQVHT